MLYLTLSIWPWYYHAIPDPDTWHQYLPCYIWPMISNTGIWHWYLSCYIWYWCLPWYMWYVTLILILDACSWHTVQTMLVTWYLTCYTCHMIYYTGIWHTMLATWYMTCYTCHLIYNTNTCHDIYDTWHLYYLAYSWLLCDQTSDTPVSPVLLYLLSSCTPEPLKKGDSCIILRLTPVVG